MRSPMVTLILLLLPLPCIAEPEGHTLFFIQRNKNRNEVHYEANLEGCRWSDPPVLSHWHNLEDGPDARSGMMLWEGPPYGFEAKRVSDNRVELRLNPLAERLITADLNDRNAECEIDVQIEVQGEPARFRHVYVQATEGFFIWSVTVDYVDIHGFAEDGRPVVERIVRSERGRTMGEPSPIP
jgi:hypothetical protein